MMPVAPLRHARLIQDAHKAGVTVEDLGRALCSYAPAKGALAAFDAEQARGEMTTGKFVEHVTKAEWLLRRATEYARDRAAKR